LRPPKPSNTGAALGAPWPLSLTCTFAQLFTSGVHAHPP